MEMQGSPTTKGAVAPPIRGVKQTAPPIKRKVYAHDMPLLDLSEVRIVVIDDNEFAMTVIRRLLRAMRITVVTTCSNPEAAAEVIQRANADILIIDIDMPVKTGLELIHEIRHGQAGIAKDISILVASAHVDLEHVEKARNEGANWIVAKPLSFRSLYDGLARVTLDDRPFIEEKGYVGPCRRTRAMPLDDPASERRTRTGPVE
jgi:CheY-like chemotaxis protein